MGGITFASSIQHLELTGVRLGFDKKLRYGFRRYYNVVLALLVRHELDHFSYYLLFITCLWAYKEVWSLATVT